MKLRACYEFRPRIAPAVVIALALVAGLAGRARHVAAQGTPAPTPGPIVYPYWDGATKRSHIYVQLPGESDARRVYDEPGSVWRAKWSPDGEQIAFADDAVFVMQADGADVRKVGDQPGIFDSDAFGWGPGDHQITYYEEDDLWDGDLWVADVDDPANSSRLTWEGGMFADPVWSPNRDRLAYTWRPHSMASARLFVMEASSGVVTPLMPDLWPQDVSWSPDGRDLVFVGKNDLGGRAVFVAEATEDARRRPIADSPYFMHAPVFLGDGSWIAFSVSGDVHVVRADGKDKQALGVIRGEFLIGFFDWHNPFRAVSAPGKLPSQWGRLKAHAHDPQTPPASE